VPPSEKPTTGGPPPDTATDETAFVNQTDYPVTPFPLTEALLVLIAALLAGSLVYNVAGSRRK
jgi:hypothetical protein